MSIGILSWCMSERAPACLFLVDSICSDLVVVQENDIVTLDCAPLNETVWSNGQKHLLLVATSFTKT